MDLFLKLSYLPVFGGDLQLITFTELPVLLLILQLSLMRSLLPSHFPHRLTLFLQHPHLILPLTNLLLQLINPPPQLFHFSLVPFGQLIYLLVFLF